MYDKVKLWIDRTMVGEQFPTIVNYLDEANTQVNHQTGEVLTFGRIEGMKITLFVGGLSVVGSLPKFLYGSNVFPLDRKTTAQAIEKISDTLHLQADNAKATEIEFGTNFIMEHRVQDYLFRLGDMPRLKRYHFEPSTLYYRGTGKQKPKTLVFYDKVADTEAKGMVCPEELKEANLLRYEIRLSGRLPMQLGVPEVTASTLYQKQFYGMMVKSYQNHYFSIRKHTQIKTDIMSEIKTPREAYDVFVARLISQTDQAQINSFLDELKEAGVFEDRKNYSRLKKKIQEVATKANIVVSDELIRELDNEIKNCGAYL